MSSPYFTDQSLQQFIANLQEAYYRTDTEGTVTLVSPVAGELMACDHNALIGTKIAGYYVDEDGRERFLKTLEASGGKVTAYEARIRRLDDEIIWVSTNAHYIRNEQGEVIGLEGTIRDITEQKRIEAKLKASEQRFRDIFEGSPDPCWIIDENNLFILCNQAAVDILDYDSIEELSATHPSKLSPLQQPDGRESFEKANEMIANARHDGVARFEWMHQRKSGETFPVNVTLASIEIGGKQGLFCTWQDITERKKAEYDLHGELKFRSQLLERATEGVALWFPQNGSIEAHFTIWNRRMVEITGYTQEEINRLGWLESMYHDETERNRARTVMQQVAAGIENSGTDFSIVNKAGEARIIHISSKSIHQVNSDDLCVLAFIQDVTELHRQQQQLKHERKRFLTLFEASSDGLFIINMQGRFIDINRTAHERLGYSKEEMMVLSIVELDTPEFAAKVPERMALLKQQGMATFETAHYRKDGSVMPVEINARIIELDGETVFFSVVRDISERKELEEQLFHSQKMEAIGTLVGGIAHDFNNMLAAIQGNLYVARMQLQHPAVAEEKLNNIEQLAGRAADMVQQLLTFARKDSIVMRPFKLNSFMNEAYKLAKAAIPEDIDHQSSICSEPLIINGDATQLQQVLMNLLNNAVDAVSAEKQPAIRCSLAPFQSDTQFCKRHAEASHGLYAHISVRDNGHGIPTDLISKIFEPFFTTKEVGKGTGLGLAMLYGAIQRHHGIIEVESEPEIGTTFHIYLPCADEEASENRDKYAERDLGHGETILLVDDERGLLSITQEVLENLGYRVLVADNGIEALEELGKADNKINLLITDLIMPRMGGLELVAQVRKKMLNLPVILTTGYDQQQLAGFDEFSDHRCSVITKPFDFNELSKEIHHLLKR